MVRRLPARRPQRSLKSSDLSICPNPAIGANAHRHTLRITCGNNHDGGGAREVHRRAVKGQNVRLTPATVPGTAKYSMVVNSMVFLLPELLSTTTQAIAGRRRQ